MARPFHSCLQQVRQAAVNRYYKGHDIIFECTNKPNGMGDDTADDLAVLCHATGKVDDAPSSLQ
jgi:hypothetical protein